MKKYFTIALPLISSSLFAQFTINGQIENYNNKPILVKLFDNGTPKTIQNVNTNATGNFTTKIPVTYNGVVRLETPSGAIINLISENENIKFKTVYGEKIQEELQAIEGNALKEYKNLQKLNPINDINTNVLPYVKNYYQPTDTFYKAIEEEQKRIEKLNAAQPINSNLVKYVNSITQLLANTKSNITPEVANEILKHIENDDDKLEHSGYLPELIYAYINYQFNTNPNNSPEVNLTKATEVLLDKGNIQTERGQNILSTIFTLVPESNFKNYYATYKAKVNDLTCKVTDDLKSKVSDGKGLKVGDKAPNVKFNQPINGKKSLYDIKADQKLIVFWASWCPACQKELPHIKEFYTNFKKNGGEIVAISLDYDQDEFNKATKDLNWYNYTDLLKWDSPLVESFDISSTPTVILLDKDNKVIKKAGHISELIDLK